jgi:DHA1 family multidrug resistance protein-like MFS transporter
VTPSPWTPALRALFAANFAASAGMFALVPFLTCFVEESGVPDPATRHRWAGWLVGAAPIVAALLSPFWGAIGDRFGRRAMVVRALLGGALFTGLMAFASTLESMLLLRILQGVVAGFVPPALALASVLAPIERRSYVTGAVQSAVSAGAVAGYLLGGTVTEHGSLRTIFPVCSALLAGSGLLVLLVVPEPALGGTGPAPARGLRSLLDDYRATLRVPAIVRFLGLLVLARLAGSMVDPHLVAYVEDLHGGRDSAGAILALEQAAILLFMPRWARRGDTAGYRRTFAICATGLAFTWALQSQASTPWQLAGARILSGIFLAGVAPAGYGLAARETPEHRRGAAMGTVFQVLALSHAAGTMGGGVVLGALGFRPLMRANAVLFLLLAAWAVIESRRSRHEPRASAAAAGGSTGRREEGILAGRADSG